MEDTEQIHMQYLKLYLIGLPGVGKTTFRKRLTRSLVNISSLNNISSKQRRYLFAVKLQQFDIISCLLF